MSISMGEFSFLFIKTNKNLSCKAGKRTHRVTEYELERALLAWGSSLPVA